jgi:hypothetical protein
MKTAPISAGLPQSQAALRLTNDAILVHPRRSVKRAAFLLLPNIQRKQLCKLTRIYPLNGQPNPAIPALTAGGPLSKLRPKR